MVHSDSIRVQVVLVSSTDILQPILLMLLMHSRKTHGNFFEFSRGCLILFWQGGSSGPVTLTAFVVIAKLEDLKDTALATARADVASSMKYLEDQVSHCLNTRRATADMTRGFWALFLLLPGILLGTAQFANLALVTIMESNGREAAFFFS